MGVNPATGNLTQLDYFEPYAYDGNNGGDLDFGSAGVALLDGSVFYGTGVNRIAVAGGKDGKVYIMNADNLGGFAGGKFIQPSVRFSSDNHLGSAGSDNGKWLVT